MKLWGKRGQFHEAQRLASVDRVLNASWTWTGRNWAVCVVQVGFSAWEWSLEIRGGGIVFAISNNASYATARGARDALVRAAKRLSGQLKKMIGA